MHLNRLNNNKRKKKQWNQSRKKEKRKYLYLLVQRIKCQFQNAHQILRIWMN